MTRTKLIFRELLQRKHQMTTAVLAIAIGIAGVVGINTVTAASTRRLKSEMENLGFNLLILPKGSGVENYYTADTGRRYLPEEYARRLVHSGLHGMNLLSPRLSGKITLRGRQFTLTGILPSEELNAKQKADPFLDSGIMTQPKKTPVLKTPERLIHRLKRGEALVGSDAAVRLGLKKGGLLRIKGKQFLIKQIRPSGGTVDDARIFVHLREAQKILNKPQLINAIEIVGCCNRIATGLIPHLDRLVPQARVVSIKQIVATQQKADRLMSSVANILLLVIVLVAGAGIANATAANVYERRREIGILMAMGAGRGTIQLLFMGKALFTGVSGGLSGFLTGSLAALLLAPAGTTATPEIIQLLLSLGIAVTVSLTASWLPARRAAAVDPCTAFREV